MTVPARVERGCIVHCVLTVGELMRFIKDVQEKSFIAVGRTQAMAYLNAGDVVGATAVASQIYKMALNQLYKEGWSHESITVSWKADQGIQTRIGADLRAAGYDPAEIYAETDRRLKYRDAQREAKKLSTINEEELGINVRDVGIC